MLRYAITDRMRLGETDLERLPALAALAEHWAAEGIDFIQIREKDLKAGALLALAAEVAAAVARGESRRAAASRAEGSSVDAAPNQRRVATRILISSRPDVAIAAGLDGVHLTTAEGTLTPQQTRQVYEAASSLPASIQSSQTEPASPRLQSPVPGRIISVSCHSLDEVRRAVQNGADLILFGPVFGKSVFAKPVLAKSALAKPVRRQLVTPPAGLDALSAACKAAGSTPVLALGGITQANTASCLEVGAKGIAAITLFNT